MRWDLGNKIDLQPWTKLFTYFQGKVNALGSRHTWANTEGSCSKRYSKNPVHLGKERRFRCELKANHFWIKWTHQSNQNSILTNRNAFTLQPFTQIRSEIPWIAEYAHRKITKVSRVQMLSYHSGNSCVPNHHFNTSFALRSLHLILFHLQYLCGRQSGKVRNENDSDIQIGARTTHDAIWNLLTQYVEHPKGIQWWNSRRIPGWIPRLEKIVSRQKACSIPLKIWYFQRKSSRWQSQWCLYWSSKVFLHTSNLCFPPTVWPWSSAVGYWKIIFGKQTIEFIWFYMWNIQIWMHIHICIIGWLHSQMWYRFVSLSGNSAI